MSKNKFAVLAVLAGFILYFASCKSEGDHPGYTILPDMAFTPAYKTYEETYIPTPWLVDVSSGNRSCRGWVHMLGCTWFSFSESNPMTLLTPFRLLERSFWSRIGSDTAYRCTMGSKTEINHGQFQ